MSAVDGSASTPWPHATMPNWSLPALEAAKCGARQSDELFECVHPRLYEAYFTKSLDIADHAGVGDVEALREVRLVEPRMDALEELVTLPRHALCRLQRGQAPVRHRRVRPRRERDAVDRGHRAAALPARLAIGALERHRRHRRGTERAGAA